MSNLLNEAIVDAKALREAALKNAETVVIEKYSEEVRDTLNKLLEQEDELGLDLGDEAGLEAGADDLGAADLGATDAGADGEVLGGGAGIVISTQGVTTQLRTLLPVLRDQPLLTAELGRHARQRVLERYTLNRNIDAIEQLYGQLTPLMPIAA